ncbi:hypothetical protein [Kitasatospora sp. NPDC088346]|uniref:hypothetical protein n=1 Tax=Kitasatospora sp. NPDC088346 TaxID=3364073 RepID=UPI00380AE2BE
MANTGFGKRSAPAEIPYSAANFAHLSAREAYLAAFIDRLPEGAAIDTKTLAREQPYYGQQAVRSALRKLSEAGHLRRFRENAGTDGVRWVQRTYFSRVPRSDAWWLAFLGRGVPADDPPDDSPPAADPPRPPRPSRPAPSERAARSDAYETLAGLGRVDARMMLSAAECAALEGAAAEWLARGATPEQLTIALTSGLPQSVHSPGALARRRLVEKLPPAPPPRAAAAAPRVRMMECTDCGRPGPPRTLPGGVCHDCRRGPAPPRPAPEWSAAAGRHVARMKDLIRAGRPGQPLAPPVHRKE